MPLHSAPNAFSRPFSPDALARVHKYQAYCQSPMGRLNWILDEWKELHAVRTAWGNGSMIRQAVDAEK